MNELYTIQQRGFHNTYDESGAVDGFEFKFVPEYYKGYWFTQCRFGNLTVDGQVYDRDKLIFEYDGIEYTREELFNLKVYWQFRRPLVIRAKKKGGLAKGYHTIRYEFGWVLNYNGEPEFEEDGSGFGNMYHIFDPVNERRLLLAR